nr:hypothetical protein [Tanacetum cinerariifolium]
MQTQTSNTLHNAIMEAGSKVRPPMLEREIILDAEGNPTTATEKVFETYKNVKHEIRDQLNAEAEAVQIILTGIDNDIYSIVDACPNACEMWKAIERLKQGESINVQDLETNLFWEFGKFTSLDGESLESYFKKIYKPTNNNLRTSSNTSHANQDNSPRIHINAGYEGQRSGTVAGARETVGSSMVYKSGIQCYNCKEYRHVARECQKPKRVKDAAYHWEKMLLCKQEEAGPIFDTEPEQKVQNDDHYDVFAIECQHTEQSESAHNTYLLEQDA